jgi:hypothetical protein
MTLAEKFQNPWIDKTKENIRILEMCKLSMETAKELFETYKDIPEEEEIHWYFCENIFTKKIPLSENTTLIIPQDKNNKKIYSKSQIHPQKFQWNSKTNNWEEYSIYDEMLDRMKNFNKDYF